METSSPTHQTNNMGIPLSLGVMCGAAASAGNYHWMWNPLEPTSTHILLGLEDTAKGFAAMVLAAPFMEGFSQTLNDWYDRPFLPMERTQNPYLSQLGSKIGRRS